MLFNSITYLLFLPVVVALYWLLPNRARLWLILVSSLVFYGFWRIEFIPLLLFSAGVDYVLARMIAASEDERRRRFLMLLSIVISLIILGIFKYLIFFVDTVGSIAALVGHEPSWPELNIILPLGISFYIFATISYTVDVYRRIVPAEKSALVYFCFVAFFPHLVAGPILRAGVLIPQLAERAAFNASAMAEGTKRIILGLFLKVVLADNVAPLVNRAFEAPQSAHGADAWTMAFLFGFQIYFDFSAYSHIAIGSALLMGIVLPENFNFPFLAKSPRDFWKRWHISLSTWVRDYLYMPLMGARPKGDGWEAMPADRDGGRGEGRRTRALFITWTLMGLWHGANWTFAIWGLFHAICIWVQRVLLTAVPVLKRSPAVLGWMVTLPLMMAAWIPFRARNLEEAFYLWGQMVDPREFFNFTLWTNSYFAAAALSIGMLIVFGAYRLQPILETRPAIRIPLQSALLAIAMIFVFVFLQVRDQFIYFQF